MPALDHAIEDRGGEPKDHVVYAIFGSGQQDDAPAGAAPSREGVDGSTQSGADRERLQFPPGVYTAIWWYASFPNHYSGDSSAANAQRGEVLVGRRADYYVEAIRAIKADESAARLQREFFGRVERPAETPQ